MKVRQSCRCQNPDRRSQIEVTKTSMEAESNPRCCCGAQMKKPYLNPTFRAVANDAVLFAEIQETRE